MLTLALAIAVAAEPPPPTPAGFAEWAKSEAVLGTNPAYLENRLGPARRKSSSEMLIDVDGCSMTYAIENGAVTSFSAELSRSCHILVRGHRVSAGMTFGRASATIGGGHYQHDCVSLCGNAWRPELHLITGGSHAEDYVHVVYSSAAFPLQEAWGDAIWSALRGEGRDFPRPGEVDCVSDPPAAVAALMNRSRVERVWIGRALTDRCSR